MLHYTKTTPSFALPRGATAHPRQAFAVRALDLRAMAEIYKGVVETGD